jgi:hypothetical protein
VLCVRVFLYIRAGRARYLEIRFDRKLAIFGLGHSSRASILGHDVLEKVDRATETDRLDLQEKKSTKHVEAMVSLPELFAACTTGVCV